MPVASYMPLKDARPAKRSFYRKPESGIVEPDLLPANVLESLSGERRQTRCDAALTARGVRSAVLVRPGERSRSTRRIKQRPLWRWTMTSTAETSIYYSRVVLDERARRRF